MCCMRLETVLFQEIYSLAGYLRMLITCYTCMQLAALHTTRVSILLVQDVEYSQFDNLSIFDELVMLISELAALLHGTVCMV
jgi:hypothetical protein